MAYKIDNLFYGQTASFTSDKEQIKLQPVLSETTSPNKITNLDDVSKYSSIFENDKKDINFENFSSFKINNFSIVNNNPSDLEEVSSFDNFSNSLCQTLNKDINMIIPLDVQKQKETAISSVGLVLEEKNNSFLNRKKERNENKYRFIRRDNARRAIARFFFNHFLKNLIEKMKKECNCILYFNYFPKKFIFEAEKKRNKHYLDYTFEQLLENKDLYKDKDPLNYYETNKKVIDELKSEKYKKIMTDNGHYKTLKRHIEIYSKIFYIHKNIKNIVKIYLKIKEN
jgi:glycerophosphoryl diester phosphodiesterase